MPASRIVRSPDETRRVNLSETDLHLFVIDSTASLSPSAMWTTCRHYKSGKQDHGSHIVELQIVSNARRAAWRY